MGMEGGQEPLLCTCNGNTMSNRTVRRAENNSHVQGPVELKVRASGLPPPQTTVQWKRRIVSAVHKAVNKSGVNTEIPSVT